MSPVAADEASSFSEGLIVLVLEIVDVTDDSVKVAVVGWYNVGVCVKVTVVTLGCVSVTVAVAVDDLKADEVSVDDPTVVFVVEV